MHAVFSRLVPLLCLWPVIGFLARGTRPPGGFRRRSAFTSTKAHGIASATTAASPTTEACSSSSQHGAVSAVPVDRTYCLLANSYMAPGLYGREIPGYTAMGGQSGPRGRTAGSDD